jgi:hypothetical protein
MTQTSPLIGRDADLDAIWDLVRSRSVLLTGPRRVGKTELLRDMVDRPRSGWRAVRVDLEGQSTIAGASHADQTPDEALVMAVLQEAPDRGRKGARAFTLRLMDDYIIEQRPDGAWVWVVPLFRVWWQRYGDAE